MRKNRGVLFLVVAVLVTVGYAIYDYQAEQKEAKAKEEEALLVSFKADQINEVDIKNASGHIVLKKDVNGWDIVEPIKDQADDTSADTYVQQLSQERSSGVAAEGHQIDWKVYGLDDPRGEVTVKNNAGQILNFKVSTKKNFENSDYVRKNNEDKVLISSSDWETRATVRALDFRNKKLMRLPSAEVRHIDFIIGKSTDNIEYVDGSWRSAQKPEWKLDQNKLREFLSSLNKVRATDFAFEGELRESKDIKKFALDKPDFKIAIKTSKDKSWSGVFSVDKERNHYVKVDSDDHFVLKISAADYEKFEKFSLDDLRDRREAFNFNKAEVKKIDFKTPLKSFTLALGQDGKWSLSPVDPKFEVLQDNVKKILAQIFGLQAQDYLPKTKVDKVARSIKMYREDGSLAFEMNISDVQKVKIGKDNVERYEVQTNLVKNAVTLSATELNALKVEELTQGSATDLNPSSKSVISPQMKDSGKHE